MALPLLRRLQNLGGSAAKPGGLKEKLERSTARGASSIHNANVEFTLLQCPLAGQPASLPVCMSASSLDSACPADVPRPHLALDSFGTPHSYTGQVPSCVHELDSSAAASPPAGPRLSAWDACPRLFWLQGCVGRTTGSQPLSLLSLHSPASFQDDSIQRGSTHLPVNLG